MESCRYPVASRLLHWLSAIVIFWATASGFTVALSDVSDQNRQFIADLNVAVTLIFIPLFLLRLVVIIRTGKPATPGLSKRQLQAASQAHCALYGAISVVLVSGVLMMERPMSVFGLMSFAPLLDTSATTEFFFTVHRYSCMILAGLVVMHLLAVLRHHRNGIPLLRKMI